MMVDITRLNRPGIGLGVQAQEHPSANQAKDWGPEMLLILHGDRQFYLETFEDMPKEDRPIAFLRWYHYDVMREDPYDYGQRKAQETREWVAEWGPHFGGVLLTNELDNAVEHGDWPTRPGVDPNFWHTMDGYRTIRDWYIPALDGYMDVAPEHNIVVLNMLHTGDLPDEPHGPYGLQALADVIDYPHPGPGKIIVGIHQYWRKDGSGLRDALRWWDNAFRPWRPAGHKDRTENVDWGDPGGIVTIFPHKWFLNTEWNSPMNGEVHLEEQYAVDVRWFQEQLQSMPRFLGSMVFLWNSHGHGPHSDYVHGGTRSMEVLKEYKDGLPALTIGVRPPPTPPGGGNMAGRTEWREEALRNARALGFTAPAPTVFEDIAYTRHVEGSLQIPPTIATMKTYAGDLQQLYNMLNRLQPAGINPSDISALDRLRVALDNLPPKAGDS